MKKFRINSAERKSLLGAMDILCVVKNPGAEKRKEASAIQAQAFEFRRKAEAFKKSGNFADTKAVAEAETWVSQHELLSQRAAEMMEEAKNLDAQIPQKLAPVYEALRTVTDRWREHWLSELDAAFLLFYREAARARMIKSESDFYQVLTRGDYGTHGHDQISNLTEEVNNFLTINAPSTCGIPALQGEEVEAAELETVSAI
jgi:hypothetical protein